MIRSCRTAAAILSAAMLAACSAAGPQTSTVAVDATRDASAAPSAPAAVQSAAVAAPSADAATRTAPVVPGRPGRVFIFAGVDDACTPIAPPALTIKRPPAQGDISFKEGQHTVLAATARGTCGGTKASGTGVYYTARSGAAGSDTFIISAKMPTGETLERTFNVTIAP